MPVDTAYYGPSTREGSLTAGARVRRARLERGLTQSELAGDQYSAAYVSIIESGKREPSEKVLKAFAKTLGVTYEELATGRRPDAEALLERELVDARRALSGGDHPSALAAFRRVSKRASQYELSAVRDRALVGEALTYEVDGNLEKAEALYTRLQETIDDKRAAIKADAVAGRARCIRMLGDVPYSIYVLESFLADLRRKGLLDPDALIRAQISLVAAYFEGGLVNRAAAAAEEALALSPRISDPERLAGMHINVARVLMEKNDYDGAARSFATAEALYAELGFQTEVGRAHLARSFLLKKKERYAEARSSLEEAVRIFEATGNTINHIRALSEMGALERVAGRPDQAVFLLERAARMASKTEPASAAISHRELALCYLSLKQPAKTQKEFKKAVTLLEDSGDKYELAVTLRAWGDALRDDAEYKSACDKYRSAAMALEAA
jgi:tetratricopeptide (TPR) repeat protein